ncbi:hypothetical protein EDB84DRAFT_1564677 [Lactarius hengduanensis]|nr:hypothetical protein EDB84DRAFT_1564677 [Lactarius hengduanensis]
MDTVGGPDAKKARWSPNSFGAPTSNGLVTPTSRDAFANCGYGSQAGIPQTFSNCSPAFRLFRTPLFHLHSPTGPAATATASGPATGSAAAAQRWRWLRLWRVNFAGGFNAPRTPSLGLASPGNYSGAALITAFTTFNNATGRTVLPATASVDELLNLVHFFGPLESIRVLPERSCVFLSFLVGSTAGVFHADATIKKLSLHGQELKIGWGKPSPVRSPAVAINQSNASRNVYLGGFEEDTIEEQLRDDLSRFGLIDQVKIVRSKNSGFVHFLSISVATKAKFSSTWVHRVPEVVRAVWTAIDTAEVWKRISSRHIRGSALLGHISSPTSLLSLPEYIDVSQADVIHSMMFSLAQPSNETVDVLPIVQLSEDAGLVQALITTLYPIPFETVTLTSYYRILALRAATQKYAMGTVQSSIRAEVGREKLSSVFLGGTQVFRAYTIASSNRLIPEMEMAARLSLGLAMTFEYF